VIINPRAGRGAVGRALVPLQRALTDRGLSHHVCQTAGPGDATRMAREALGQGIRFLVAVGGDGTVHEVVNGMMGEAGPGVRDAVLGVVAAGSGGDFARTFGLRVGPEAAAARLDGDTTRPIDVGHVSYRDEEGNPGTRWFANIADVGFSAEATARAATLPRILGPGVYGVAALATLARFGLEHVRVTLDSASFEAMLSSLVVANCRFFGGGMMVAPNAVPDDGLLDVLAIGGHRAKMVVLAPKLYKGKHVPHPDIQEYRSRLVRVECDKPLRIEADGEVLGYTPAVFELTPKALRLKL